MWRRKKGIKQYVADLRSEVHKRVQFSVAKWGCVQPAILRVLVKVVGVTRVSHAGQDGWLGEGEGSISQATPGGGGVGLTISPRCRTWSQLIPLNHLWFLTSSAPCCNGADRRRLVALVHMHRPPQPHPPSLLQHAWFGLLLAASLLDPCKRGAGSEGRGVGCEGRGVRGGV